MRTRICFAVYIRVMQGLVATLFLPGIYKTFFFLKEQSLSFLFVGILLCWMILLSDKSLVPCTVAINTKNSTAILIL